MPISKIPRSFVPIFSKLELDKADLCARALWHGINFKTGFRAHTSDADLLNRFATPFYHIPLNNGAYTTSLLDLHDLLVACELKVLYRGGSKMDGAKGLNAIAHDIFPYVYKDWLARQSSQVPYEYYAADAVQRLSDALVLPPDSNRIVLASRMLFFIVPDMQCFNMNGKVAVAFGLPTRPHYARIEFCELMAKGLRDNLKILKSYNLPINAHGVDAETYTKTQMSDWWQRRVLDLAVLIRLGFAKPVPNLNVALAEFLRDQNIGP